MKNRFPREFYIPKGATQVRDEQSTAVAYTYEAAGAAYALGFQGKAEKPSFHYRYRDGARRDQAVQDHFQSVRATEKRRQDARAARKAWAHSFKVGDILNTCWGYDQTNVEYFEITEVKGKHVILREIASEERDTGFMQGRCAPMAGQYIGAPIRRLAQPGGVRISSCQWASPTDFKEVAGVKIYRESHVSHYA